MPEKASKSANPTAKNKGSSITVWQSESDLVDAHARRYMPATLYKSRVRVLAPPTSQGSFLAQDCHRTLTGMLKGKERLYDVQSTRAAQRDSRRFLASRDLLRVVDALTERALDQAFVALKKLKGIGQKHQCWLEGNPIAGAVEFDAIMDFSEQFSRPYLRWIRQVRLATPKVQFALRRYLDSEFHLNAISRNPHAIYACIFEGADEPKERKIAEKRLDQLRKNLEPEVLKLADSRHSEFHSTRMAFEEIRVGRMDESKPYAAWPFPLRLCGAEDGETLAAAVASYQVLGKWMTGCGAGLSFIDLKSRALSPGGQLEAKDYWNEIRDAGEALVYLGAALHALVRVESVPRCQLCYRHVGLDFRKYCDIHARPEPPRAEDTSHKKDPKSVHVRTQHRQSKLISEDFKQRFELLEKSLRSRAVWRKPTDAIEDALSRSRRRAGRNPHEMGSTWVQRAADIETMVDTLKPVLGEVLHGRMHRLQVALTDWVADTARLAENSANEDAIADLNRRVESLTMGGFFAAWFSGFSNHREKNPFVHKGSDSTHSMTTWNLIPTGNVYSPLRRISPFDLDSIVRDLLLHHAWLEVGGEDADAAILAGGAPLPGLRPKGKVDVVEALRLRGEEAMSDQEIGEIFGVTRAAVYLAIKRQAARDVLDKTNSASAT